MSIESPESTIRSDGRLNRSIAPSAPALLTSLVDDAAAGDGDRVKARCTPERALASLRGGPASANAPRSRPPRGGLAPWQAKRVATYIREHIGATLRASGLAAVVQLSNSHFHRAFKVTFQETPTAYVMRQRMRLAQEMMLTTCHPLSQVALQCGLCDQAHFSRMFRRFVGQSPRLWRREFASGSIQPCRMHSGLLEARRDLLVHAP
jgi:AraC family transcriptional regulator